MHLYTMAMNTSWKVAIDTKDNTVHWQLLGCIHMLGGFGIIAASVRVPVLQHLQAINLQQSTDVSGSNHTKSPLCNKFAYMDHSTALASKLKL